MSSFLTSLRLFSVRSLLLFSLFSVVLTLASCDIADVVGSGNRISETRVVSGFTAVNDETFADVLVQAGSTSQTVTVTGDDNIVPYIRTEVINNTLRISLTENRTFETKQPTIITVSAPFIQTLTSGGSGNMTAINLLTDTLTQSVTGSGNLTTSFRPIGMINLMRSTVSGSGVLLSNLTSVRSLESVVSGSGRLRLVNGTNNMTAISAVSRLSGSGTIMFEYPVQSHTITLSGSGNVLANMEPADSVQVSISGSGDAALIVRRFLRADISGSGNVDYMGSPTVIANITGSGRVLRR